MKKFISFLVLSLFVLCLPISNASAAQTDLLRGLQPEVVHWTLFITPKSNATDGDDSTYTETKPYKEDVSFAYKYILAAPTTLNKIRIKVDSLGGLGSKISLLDSNSNLISNIPLTSTEQVVIFDPVDNVKYIQINGVNNTNLKLYTLEAYSKEAQPPAKPSTLTTSGGDGKVNLTWDSVPNSTGYNVKRSTTAGGPYVTVSNNVPDTKYVDTTAVNGTQYYYVVTALNADGESANSNEAYATPLASQPNPNPQPTGDRAILTITMTNGLEKEYDLSNNEITSFMSWYDAKDAGRGPSFFAINKGTNNKGPFSARKDYVIFDKILTFEVSEYNLSK
ncbi:fibronectin type III domain-containing protein [Paenibacillus sp. J22TS3]|uniref:fibronectin type III domain-containing protein n=1 Tax=Paenibacillus sp. J22TS3 TaxID=2807192 RepID=UPI001AFDFF98|nr:fibronectin type III domain-containing protein [Paenibacillus sp. J22TS3]GIP20907.1 hypothetical protein J22TS3_11820 [Paenibacillus sp. J22TS3]